MQFRSATLIVAACVAALFGFAGAASRSCAPVDAAAQASLTDGPGAHVAVPEQPSSPSLQQ